MFFKITFHVRRKYSVSITVRELKSRNRRSGGSGGFFCSGSWTSTPSLPFRIAEGGRIVKRENGAPAGVAGAPFRELEALLIRISDSN